MGPIWFSAFCVDLFFFLTLFFSFSIPHILPDESSIPSPPLSTMIESTCDLISSNRGVVKEGRVVAVVLPSGGATESYGVEGIGIDRRSRGEWVAVVLLEMGNDARLLCGKLDWLHTFILDADHRFCFRGDEFIAIWVCQMHDAAFEVEDPLDDFLHHAGRWRLSIGARCSGCDGGSAVQGYRLRSTTTSWRAFPR